MRHIGRVSAPVVFDRSLVRRRLRRAVAAGYADFLLRRAVDDLEDRLAAVLRGFPVALDLGTPTAAAAERLGRSVRARAAARAGRRGRRGRIGDRRRRGGASLRG
jgi:hypothetical protein